MQQSIPGLHLENLQGEAKLCSVFQVIADGEEGNFEKADHYGVSEGKDYILLGGK